MPIWAITSLKKSLSSSRNIWNTANPVAIRCSREPPTKSRGMEQVYRDVAIQGSGRIRLVTHLDIDENDIETVIAAFEAYFADQAAGASGT